MVLCYYYNYYYPSLSASFSIPMSSSSSSTTQGIGLKKVVTFADHIPSCCIICNNEDARYRCPRCHQRYCSVACYKEHSNGRCSQGFYHDEVMSYTQVNKPTEEEKRNVEMMIYDNNNNSDDISSTTSSYDDDDDDDEVLNLYRLLDALDDDDGHQKEKDMILAHLGDYLSQEQINDFRSELKSGKLYHQFLNKNTDDDVIEEWSPWWKDKVLASERSYEATANRRLRRHLCCDGTLTLVVKEDIIVYRICSVLYGYTKLVRQYMGDWSWDVVGVSSELLSSCSFLCGREDNHLNCIDYDNLRQMAITNMYNDPQAWQDVSDILDNERSYQLLMSILYEIRTMLVSSGIQSKKEIMALRLLESYTYHHIYRDEEGRNIVMLLKAEVDQLIGDLHHQMEEVKDVEDKLATVKGEDDDKHLLIMKSKVMEDDDKLIQEINTHT